MIRQGGGQDLKSLRQVYKDMKVRVATYKVLSPSRWIRVAWRRKYSSEYKSLKSETEIALREIGLEVGFKDEIWKSGEKVKKDWSGCWKELKKDNGEKLKNEYKEKVIQSQLFVGQKKESHMWLNLNTTSQKTAGIMNMSEQIVKTRKYKAMRGIGDTD